MNKYIKIGLSLYEIPMLVTNNSNNLRRKHVPVQLGNTIVVSLTKRILSHLEFGKQGQTLSCLFTPLIWFWFPMHHLTRAFIVIKSPPLWNVKELLMLLKSKWSIVNSSNVRRGRVDSVRGLEPDFLGAIPSRGTAKMECPLGKAHSLPSMILVRLQKDHE